MRVQVQVRALILTWVDLDLDRFSRAMFVRYAAAAGMQLIGFDCIYIGLLLLGVQTTV